MHSYYPWQKNEWDTLLSCRQNHRLPHAILLHGVEGLGKLNFALAFAELLLCINSGDSACGECRSCKLIKAGNYPDLFLIKPEDKDKNIKIDQIREMIATLGHTAQQGGYQIVIISPADAMNASAANALLKTLEEPLGDQTMIILTSANIALLPATIRSRCQQILLQVPDITVARQWLFSHIKQSDINNLNLETILALVDNAPLRALEFIKNDAWEQREQLISDFLNLRTQKVDIAAFSARYVDYDTKFILLNIILQIHDLIKIINRAEEKFIINSNVRVKLNELSVDLPAKIIFNYLDELLLLSKHLASGINLNKQLLLEKIALGWRDLC